MNPKRSGIPSVGRTTRRARWPLLLLAVFLYTQCSTDDGSPSRNNDASSSVSHLTSMPLSGRALPLQYLIDLDAKSQDVLRRAVDLLNRQCMASRGFVYLAYPSRPFRSIVEPNSRYGYIDPTAAQHSGYESSYRVGDPPNFLAAVDEIDRQRRAYGPEYDVALYGDGSERVGCQQESEKTIYGVVGGFSRVSGADEVFQLQIQSNEALYADPQALEAVSSWSACMKQAGYEFSSWWQARGAFANQPETSSDEKVQAHADSQCRSETGFETRLFEIESRKMQELIDRNPETVTSLQQTIDAATARALAVLSGT